MKNKKLKKNKSRNKLVATIVVALLLCATIAYVTFFRDNSSEVSQQEQQTAEQADVDSAKQRVEEESQNEPLKDNEQSAEDNSTTQSAEPIMLSNLSFSQSDGMVRASVEVSGMTSGDCSFIFTDSDGRAITKAAQVSAGKCSLSAPEVEFTNIGQYSLVAKVKDKSISKTINID
ncbi:MAG: hypothetical protein H6799_02150 [Candidatus Nomurabacteria bacterium]|nr:MAG: hypothetical protein H6799_02150 [Candidatus Nomurabacteria bacterium]HRV76247.1 hypothetical protein [Candidatus Saccharimonadales bacterium]